MEFEWSEAKRIAVLEARGLDFIDAEMLFDGRLSVGELNGRFVCVVWTWRGHSGHHDEESPR